jgi:hypothetical protein
MSANRAAYASVVCGSQAGMASKLLLEFVAPVAVLARLQPSSNQHHKFGQVGLLDRNTALAR